MIVLLLLHDKDELWPMDSTAQKHSAGTTEGGVCLSSRRGGGVVAAAAAGREGGSRVVVSVGSGKTRPCFVSVLGPRGPKGLSMRLPIHSARPSAGEAC